MSVQGEDVSIALDSTVPPCIVCLTCPPPHPPFSPPTPATQDTAASASTCEAGASSRGPSSRSNAKQQQRVAPYSPTGSLQAPGMLQLAITTANTSLEAALLHFDTACTATPGSAAALAALDAAEAAVAHTNRMTSIASVLAKRCLGRGTLPAATVVPLLEQTERLRQQLSGRLGAQLQQHGAVMWAAAGVAPAQAVEEGEEVSSSCRSDTTDCLHRVTDCDPLCLPAPSQQQPARCVPGRLGSERKSRSDASSLVAVC